METITTIKSLRKKLGLTQTQLAQKAGVSKPTIIKMERSKGPVMRPVFVCVCAALGVDPEEIKDTVALRGA